MKFIDLFAGIGGFRLGFESVGYKCVFSSEINELCQETYEKNYGHRPHGDIYDIDINDIPDFDVLTGGFPCQPFSISGKKNGFNDTRGTLFFRICEIVEIKKPKLIVLENVKHLVNHDKKRTINVILRSLRDLGYYVDYKVLNAKDFGVPQNRERTIIIGKSKEFYSGPFDFKKIDKYKSQKESKIIDILDSKGEFDFLKTDEYTIIDNPKKQPSGLIFNGYRNKNIRTNGTRPNTEHLSRVHKQPNRIYSVEGTHPTLSSQETSGRYYIYIPNIGQVRKLTINECYKIMGFPNDFKIADKVSAAYNQIGNSVCVPVVHAIAQGLSDDENREASVMDYVGKLEELVYEARENDDISDIPEKYQNYLSVIGDNSKNQKGVYTVFIALSVYKLFHKNQDIRIHQATLEGGFSGRSFDTQYITPTLKRLGLPAMNESGWLTRSLEQPYPYTLDYNGRINNKNVKEAFLNSIDYIENYPDYIEDAIKIVLRNAIKKQNENRVEIVPLAHPERLTIMKVVDILEEHFTHD